MRKSNSKPDDVAAGEAIAEMRRLSKRYAEAAESGKYSFPEAARRHKRLKTFCEKVVAGIGKRYSQRDDFVVWANLILAYDDIYLIQLQDEDELCGSKSVEAARNNVLRMLLQRAVETGDQLVEKAARWNAQQGGAHV